MDSLTLIVGIIALATGGGVGFLTARQRSAPAASIENELIGNSEARTHLYLDRFKTTSRWQEVFTVFLSSFMHAFSVDEIAALMTSSLRHEYTDMSILIALGSVRDIMLLQTLASVRTTSLELDGVSCTLVDPPIEKQVAHALALELYELVKKHQHTDKKWFLVRDAQPQLQAHMHQRIHNSGQSMIVPLYFGKVLCGVMLFVDTSIGASHDATADFGRFAVMLGEVLVMWVRCMAPQLMAGTAADPVATLPAHAISTLSVLEQSANAIQGSHESEVYLGELMHYAQTINTYHAETAMLASQTCASLLRLCQADVALFFLPGETTITPSFSLEAMRTQDWSWSHFQGFQGSENHPKFSSEETVHWTDRFVELANQQHTIIQASTMKDIQPLAKTLSEKFELASLVVIPALLRDHVAAILVIGRKQPGAIAESAQLLAMSLASLASMSLATMYLLKQEQSLRGALDNAWSVAGSVTRQAVSALASIAQKRGILTHIDPVKRADWSELIGQAMHLKAEEILPLRMAALCCDLGMVMIPSHIARKEGGLTGEELKLVQNHPIISVSILEGFDIMKQSIPIILHHHERYDGTGYPDGLKQDAIPLGARILAAADAFVHMQIDRPYRKALSLAETLTVLRQGAGTQFDPLVVHAILKMSNQLAQEAETTAVVS